MAIFEHTVTLVANVVTSVALNADYETIHVLNDDGTAEVRFTIDGSTPTVGGDTEFVIPASIGERKVYVAGGSGAKTVKLISSGTPKVVVSAE